MIVILLKHIICQIKKINIQKSRDLIILYIKMKKIVKYFSFLQKNKKKIVFLLLNGKI